MPYCGAREWKIGNCCTGNSQHLKQLNLAKSLLWQSPWPGATGMAAAAVAFEIRSAKQRNRVPNKSTNTGTAGSAWLAGGYERYERYLSKLQPKLRVPSRVHTYF